MSGSFLEARTSDYPPSLLQDIEWLVTDLHSSHQHPSFVSRMPPFHVNVTFTCSVKTVWRSFIMSFLLFWCSGISAWWCSFKLSFYIDGEDFVSFDRWDYLPFLLQAQMHDHPQQRQARGLHLLCHQHSQPLVCHLDGHQLQFLLGQVGNGAFEDRLQVLSHLTRYYWLSFAYFSFLMTCSCSEPFSWACSPTPLGRQNPSLSVYGWVWT